MRAGHFYSAGRTLPTPMLTKTCLVALKSQDLGLVDFRQRYL